MIEIASGVVRAELVPERGALVTRLRVGDRELLYLDRATLDDRTQHVRGGIPLLFPFAGKLVDDTLVLTGTKLPQHGFARDRAWVVTEQDTTTVRMTLESDAATWSGYPYPFTARHSVRVIPRGLQLELTVIAGDQSLPVSPGWHPYFAVPLETKAQVTGAGVAPGRFVDDREIDVGMVAPIEGRSRFEYPALCIEASPELRHLQLWTLPGKPFVCIEPFFGPAGTINTEARGWVPQGLARTFWLRITA